MGIWIINTLQKHYNTWALMIVELLSSSVIQRQSIRIKTTHAEQGNDPQQLQAYYHTCLTIMDLRIAVTSCDPASLKCAPY